MGEIRQETTVGSCIKELIPSADHPHPWDQRGQEGEDPVISKTITLTLVYTLLTEANTQFTEYEPGKGIIRREGWGRPTPDQLLWITEDTLAAQALTTWT